MGTSVEYNEIRNLTKKVKEITLKRVKDLSTDTAISKPVPIIIDGVMYIKYFFYPSPVVRVDPTNTGKPELMQKISTPSKWAQFNFLTCEFVSDSNFETSMGQDKQFEYFPDKQEIKDLSKEEYTKLLNKFDRLYILRLLEYFKTNLQEFRQHETDLNANFNDLFELLTPNILKPYYNKLNPEFFSWLKI